MRQLFFNVNGKDIQVYDLDPECSLAYYLRNTLGLTGTKLGCEEGICGSCTVVIGTWDHDKNKAIYKAVNACVVPVFNLHRTFVITIEGIGNIARIHPLQDRLARGHGSQCGFCSPGFIMSAYALLRNNPNPTIDEINLAIKGNLCRCTGYRPILEALYSFSGENTGCCKGKLGSDCCKNQNYVDKIVSFVDFPKYDPTQEIIFPPSLLGDEDDKDEYTMVYSGKRVEVILPKDPLTFISELRVHPNAIIISSGMITRLLTPNKLENDQKKIIWISTKYVPGFDQITKDINSIRIGSALSISEMTDILSENLKCGKDIKKFLNNYSSQQIANIGSWIGSIVATAKSESTISDIFTLLITLNIRLNIIYKNIDKRSIIGIEEFISEKLYNCSVVECAEVDTTIDQPLFCYKYGETGEQDQPIYNFCALGNKRIFTGSGGVLQRFSALEGRCREYIENAIKILNLNKIHAQLFQRYADFLGNCEISSTVDDDQNYNFLQYFKPKDSLSVGRPLSNSNERCATGEALYVNDLKAHNALHLGFVLSNVAHAQILSVDPSEALEIGAEGYFGINDVPANNIPGLSLNNMGFPDNTPVFADHMVHCCGQIIGVVAAGDVLLARRAASLVRVEYKPLPSIIELRKAIAHNSLLGDVQHVGKPEDEVNAELDESEKLIEGEISVGGQEHFYMETQNTLVIPGETDELIVYCATQGTSFTQLMISEVLGIPAHKIVVKTKRMGGAFGGKVSSATWIAAICAIVAKKTRRAVYGCLSRQDDLQITGKRHPILAKYRVGFNKSGKINAAHYKVWVNGGWSKDHTEGVTMVMGLKVDDVYNMGKVRFDGYPMKTNTCSNTAVRGYGNPQAKLVNEGIIRRIAHELGMENEDVMRVNFALEGENNFLGAKIHSDALLECWDCCKSMSDFGNRKDRIDQFNRNSKHLKRGIAMSTVRFGLPHPGATSHGIASLLINLDGSIQLSIGGTEMGQGLNQKMLQVCSEALKRPIHTITIIDSSTDKVTNAPETGGSQNADTNGLAVLACCQRIMKELQPILVKNDGDWNKSVREAYNQFIPLQCTEYGIVDREKFGVDSHESPYNTTGACTIEIEIDCIRGYNKLIRVDIVMDVGESLNPGIDIGQIEGAFMQAYGLVTCEQITFDSETGKLVQDSASKYRIPKPSMVAKDFRVKLLGTDKCKGAQVYSSKGVGEPPLIMSCGAINSAILKAIKDWRNENGIMEFVETVSPLSATKIRNLCPI